MEQIVLLHSMIGYWHHASVCPSVTLCVVALMVGAGRRGLKVVPSYSWDGASYSLLQTLLLRDIQWRF